MEHPNGQTRQAPGDFFAQQQIATIQNSLLGHIFNLISDGELPGLLRKLNVNGLEQQVSSWIGEAKTLPVSAEQITDALGEDTIQKIAQESGVEQEYAATYLAQQLPQIVHQLTPYGLIPQDGMLQRSIDLLRDKMCG